MGILSNDEVTADLFEENKRLKQQIAEYQEDMEEISDIVSAFYTEGEKRNRLIPYLLPIASQLGLIHRISLGLTRKKSCA